MAKNPKSAKATAPNTGKESNPLSKGMRSDVKVESLSKKKAKTQQVTVRRSGRVQNLTPTQNETKEVISSHIDLVESENESESESESESEKEEDSLHGERSDSQPIPTLAIENMGEKMDNLMKIMKEAIKRAAAATTLPTEPVYTDFNYKSMYIDSQKKIESLREENLELNKDLQFARGQIEVYKKMDDVIFNFKESLGKVKANEETMINASSQDVTTTTTTNVTPTQDAPDGTESELKVATNNAPEPRASRYKRKQR